VESRLKMMQEMGNHRLSWCSPMHGFFGMLLLCLASAQNSPAAPPVYDLDIKKGKESEILRLYQRASKRTIWTRRVSFHGRVGWSTDRRALAIEIGGGTGILVWREGHTPRLFNSSPLGYDYAMGFAWSPDHRRLLLRIGGSGSADVDVGRLHCLNVETGKFSAVTSQGVRKMAWGGRRKVLYWTVHDIGNPSVGYRTVVARTPRTWNCP